MTISSFEYHVNRIASIQTRAYLEVTDLIGLHHDTR